MSMLGLALRRHCRNPGGIGDLAELAPLLAPALAAIEAAEEVTVLGSGEHQIGIGGIRADGPDDGVRLLRKWHGEPRGPAIARVQKEGVRSRCAVADSHE